MLNAGHVVRVLLLGLVLWLIFSLQPFTSLHQNIVVNFLK